MKILTEEEFYNLPKEQKTGCVLYNNGTKHWYKEDKCHRDDGPAVEYPNGDKVWYKNGQLHRDDGPAIELIIGTKDYFLNNIRYSYQKWFAIVNNLEKFI